MNERIEDLIDKIQIEADNLKIYCSRKVNSSIITFDKEKVNKTINRLQNYLEEIESLI